MRPGAFFFKGIFGGLILGDGGGGGGGIRVSKSARFVIEGEFVSAGFKPANYYVGALSIHS